MTFWRKVLMVVLCATAVLRFPWSIARDLSAPDGTARYDEVLRSLVPEDEASLARRFLYLLASGNLDGARAMMLPGTTPSAVDARLHAIGALFPNEVPSEMKVVGYQVHTLNDFIREQSTTRIEMQYAYTGCYVWCIVVRSGVNGIVYVTGVEARRLDRPLDDVYRVRLADAEAWRSSVLVLAVAVPVFMLLTALACLRRAWPTGTTALWLAAILVGYGWVMFDWTSKTLVMDAFAPGFFGCSITRASPYSSLVVKFSLPLGAIAFWGHRLGIVKVGQLKRDTGTGRTPGRNTV